MTRGRSAAARRLRRIRWTTTLVFACTTALCLVVLGVIASNIDSASRQHDLDLDLNQRATSLAQTAYFDGTSLKLARLTTDSVARTSQAFGIVSDNRIQLASLTQADLPADVDLAAMVHAVEKGKRIVDVAALSARGHPFEWAAGPIFEGKQVGAVVLVGGDSAPSDAAHLRLIWALVGTIVSLIAIAGAAGHLISGRAMRPALRSLEQQEQFLVEAAHELRTPLATLRLVVDRGLRNPAEAGAALGRVSDRIDRLGELVSNLLIRARAESGAQAVELVPVRLDQIVEVAVNEVVGSAGVQVSTRPSIVRGNAELLSQAVRNLVENALRYAPGARIEVAVVDGVVSVIDAGQGIPSNERDAVLMVGVGSGKGTGTGLAIVAWVAELHGGSVRLSESDAGGLRVDLTIPEASSSAHREGRILES